MWIATQFVELIGERGAMLVLISRSVWKCRRGNIWHLIDI